MTSHSPKEQAPHPALTFSKTRAEAWEKQATDEDFYKYLQGLEQVYAKRKYTGNGILNEKLLRDDYEQWKKEKKDEVW